jgi:signal transduction histidine kinase
MDAVRRTATDPATYRRLAYLLSALPLGTVWFTALVTVWSLTLGLVITPLVIPLLFAMAFMTRGFAAVEAEIARSLLRVDAQAPGPPPAVSGFWARLRSLFGPDFWRAQAYLMVRWFVGFPVAVAVLTLLGVVVGLISAPIWVPFNHDGAQLGIWNPHSFVQALALVPLGILLAPLSLLVIKPLAELFAPLASGLLRPEPGRGVPGPLGAGRPGLGAQPLYGGSGPMASQALQSPHDRRQGLRTHAAVDGIVVAVLTVIWAVTSLGYFWPIWTVLPLATALGIHGWMVALAEQPRLIRRFGGSRALASTVGVVAAIELFCVAVWAVTSHGYFWPIWPLLGLAIVVAAIAVTVLLGSPRQAEMAERIETLESTRAGAVDVQDSELRRIERDLHDGAQARLVALGMSLGMAEQKLADDPERVGQLLAEARAGAEQALRELRDLARGIHPPVLADRGLEAALAALANSTPLHVSLSVDVPHRPAAPVESAAYFVAAEALANAAKHARADWLDIRIARIGNTLELEVKDDGVGGADPNGSGLIGLRRRVEALDGTLQITSPQGGPTTVYAELPCA